MKKKPYSPPTVKTLTPEQARNFIADRKNYTEQEAAEFLESVQRQYEKSNQKWDEAPNDKKEKDTRKRSAW
jgi:uncharacterized Zn finger protein